MACPWERDTCSNVCAVFRAMMLLLLPMSKWTVSISSTTVPLFAAKASSWRSPNIPGTSDSVVPYIPLRRRCSNTQSFLDRDVKTFMYPRASSSVMGFFSNIQAVGYSSYVYGRDADAVGMFMNVSSSTRMPI
eukprot:1419-Pyramimonas_sp.AAC.1